MCIARASGPLGIKWNEVSGVLASLNTFVVIGSHARSETEPIQT